MNITKRLHYISVKTVVTIKKTIAIQQSVKSFSKCAHYI